MKIEFLTKNYNPSEKLKELTTKKIQKLDKFFQSDTKIKVVLKQSKDIYTLELTIMADNAVMRTEVSGDNMYSNVDTALRKLETQIIKHHKKLGDKSKRIAIKPDEIESISQDIPETRAALVRSKTFTLIPMSVEDAIDELELIGHSFYVFLNKMTSSVNVLYLRNDGDYGLIETIV